MCQAELKIEEAAACVALRSDRRSDSHHSTSTPMDRFIKNEFRTTKEGKGNPGKVRNHFTVRGGAEKW
jgi:hypothetical protein